MHIVKKRHRSVKEQTWMPLGQNPTSYKFLARTNTIKLQKMWLSIDLLTSNAAYVIVIRQFFRSFQILSGLIGIFLRRRTLSNLKWIPIRTDVDLRPGSGRADNLQYACQRVCCSLFLNSMKSTEYLQIKVYGQWL